MTSQSIRKMVSNNVERRKTIKTLTFILPLNNNKEIHRTSFSNLPLTSIFQQPQNLITPFTRRFLLRFETRSVVQTQLERTRASGP